ncbi:C1QL [Mytilus edulis]|uniref:C1QL n=2 Tax=Mytilus TaxID=6548 RepID=A0A8S3SLS0_MYTED|nr:C1QL [Mytilus edulis]CBX41651.1 putative C1q domain containing protein MgC1q2 [Mytilus galloprovincialis]
MAGSSLLHIALFGILLCRMQVICQTSPPTLTDVRKDLLDLDSYVDNKLRAIDTKIQQTACYNQGHTIVTFLARLVTPDYGTIAAKATLKFEKTTENVGNGYDNKTGIFTAPVKGLYHFTASARQSRSGYLHLGLYRNDEEMAVSVGVNYNSLTIGATFTLQSGDHVLVKNIWTQSSGIVGAGQSYFSGHLVHVM